MEKTLPSIPAKRYFTIGEVSELCGVKPYVLRYWEQEFTQLKPMKRRGNRRYYQHHEVLLIRRIRDLLYDQGFTISGARNQLGDLLMGHGRANGHAEVVDAADAGLDDELPTGTPLNGHASADSAGAELPLSMPLPEVLELAPGQLRAELLSIRALLQG